MMGYHGAIHISDGREGHWVEIAGEIIVKGLDGTQLIIETNGQTLRGHKFMCDGKLMEHERLGQWYRGYRTFKGRKINGRVHLPYRQKSIRSIHGIAKRTDQTLFGFKGRCRTMYSHGRFVWQEFRYENKRLAYRIHHRDHEVTIWDPNKKVAAIIKCPGGFSAWTTSAERQWGEAKSHSCRYGETYFDINARKQPNTRSESTPTQRFDFSKNGNCQFTFFYPSGKIRSRGEYRNRQRSGEWILEGRSVFLLDGIEVSKKLWNTPPEKLKVTQILKIKNAQLRSALLKKIGPGRLVTESKSKVIDKTKTGMKLFEFPISMDDGNGGVLSKMRILQVTCPSTQGKYYLSVPDFVWNGGRKTKLNTCELARQWTFGVDDPSEKVKFAKET